MLPCLLVVLGIVARFVPHLPNMTPVGAAVLFGGAYLGKRYALLVPLAILLATDLVIGLHATIPFTWGSFLLIGLLGLWLRDRKRPLPIIGAAAAGSTLFFLVTNFGVWAVSGMYPKDLGGLLTAYVAALPFYGNMLVGDLLYVGALFGGYEAIRVWLAQREAGAVSRAYE